MIVKSIKNNIPNFITILNLSCGFIGIIFIIEGLLLLGSLMIVPALIFDFSDGLFARLLNAKSEIGKQLDSLSDMISFGVLPGLLMYSLLKQYSFNTFLPYIALIIPAFSALRLAKFNIDLRQTDSFIGLPTPMSAMFFGSLPFILYYKPLGIINICFFENILFLVFSTIFISIMLIVNIPMFSLKIKSLNLKQNLIIYIFLIVSVLLLLWQFLIAIPIIVILYILISITNNFFIKTN